MRRPSWNKSQAIQQVISLKALLEPSDDDTPPPPPPAMHHRSHAQPQPQVSYLLLSSFFRLCFWNLKYPRVLVGEFE